MYIPGWLVFMLVLLWVYDRWSNRAPKPARPKALTGADYQDLRDFYRIASQEAQDKGDAKGATLHAAAAQNYEGYRAAWEQRARVRQAPWWAKVIGLGIPLGPFLFWLLYGWLSH